MDVHNSSRVRASPYGGAYRPRTFSYQSRGRYRRMLWLEMVAELGGDPSAAQSRMIRRIIDLEIEVALSHAQLAAGKLSASGVRLLTAIDRNLRALKAELFAPPRALPKPVLGPAMVEPKPKSEGLPAPSLAEALAAGREDPPS
jgi:hypothetical protein